MLPELERRFSGLQDRKEALLERLAGLDEKALNFKPSSDSWCLLQVADHVQISEGITLDNVRKKLPHVKPSSRPGVRSKWVFPLLRLVLASPLRFKIPSPIRETLGPGKELTLEGLSDRWAKSSSGWKELLEKIPAEMMKAPLFRHPIAGRMNLGGAMEFLEVHFDHHLRQVGRLFAHPDFPAHTGT